MLIQVGLSDFKTRYSDINEQDELLFRVSFSIELGQMLDTEDIESITELVMSGENPYKAVAKRMTLLQGRYKWMDESKDG